jgi:diguanylate cyclase (GGDEF)-like protein
MLIKRLLQTNQADAELPAEIRAALIHSLFAPVASLIVGAAACSIVGAAVALRVGDPWIMTNSVVILMVGMLRVVSALLYKRAKDGGGTAATRLWERAYECGAWAFSASLGALCFLTITHTTDASLQMAVATTSAGYAAAISGRNAGRPDIAVGQLTLITLPLAVALLAYPDWVHKTLGFVVLMFIYGMVDITLSIRDIIIQALTMTRKEAALAAQFEQQASRFDIAINNMSHGLCMLDQQDRLQVWNARFQELLNLRGVPMRVGMPMRELLRHSIRARNYKGRSLKKVFSELARYLPREHFEQVEISPDGQRTIALSRRTIADGGSVLILEDVTERKRVEQRIAHLARFDELTGLGNRMQFRERIDGLLTAVRRSEQHIAIHLIDLDRFKGINDTLGHPVGDKLLKEVAGRLVAVVQPADMITRFGGDEFVVLQSAAEPRREARRLANELAQALGAPFDIDGHRIDIGASIGIAVAPLDGTDADQLLQKADMALYAAKSSGGGKHCFFAPEMEEAVQGRRALELDLREALASEQFQLEFQPLVDLRSGRVTTCEALLRWRHPVRGHVPPSVFIPVTEETGLIVPLGEWVLQRACVEAATWPSDVKVAVNLSPVQFRDGGLAFQVLSALAKSGLPAGRLELEITERVLLDESENTLLIMQQLKELGVGLSLDDFGTGYSSLNYLRTYPFDKIKIDRSFIHDLGQERGASAIIHAVASLGAGLEKIVVAEGVETKEQMDLVRAQGCHEGQGYFFDRPMAAAATRLRLEVVAGRQPSDDLIVDAQLVA